MCLELIRRLKYCTLICLTLRQDCKTHHGKRMSNLISPRPQMYFWKRGSKILNCIVTEDVADVTVRENQTRRSSFSRHKLSATLFQLNLTYFKCLCGSSLTLISCLQKITRLRPLHGQ